MTVAALLSLFLISVLSSSVLYENHQFVQHSGSQMIHKTTQQRDLLVNFDNKQCVKSLVVKTEESSLVEVQSNEDDVWSTLVSGNVGPDGETIEMDGTFCVERLRLLSQSTVTFVSMSSDEATKKRILSSASITCEESEQNGYPLNCEKSSPFCVPAADHKIPGDGLPLCGCRRSADCFQAARPFCERNPGILFGSCEGCTKQNFVVASVQGASNHLWCRMRFPSVYSYRDTTPDVDGGFTNLENIPVPLPSTEQRPLRLAELCDPTDGSCQRCDQATQAKAAPLLQSPVVWPSYAALPANVRLSHRGSYFCNELYSASVTGLNQVFPGAPSAREFGERPICSSPGNFIQAQLCGGANRVDCATSNNDDNNTWKKGEVTLNYNRPPNPATPAGENNFDTLDTVDSPSDFEGACMPCEIKDTPANGGGLLTKFHSLCNNFMPTQPICKGPGCGTCSSNNECYPDTLDKSTADAQKGCRPGTFGQCTGGTNCQNDGSCIYCKSDLDCKSATALLDGPPGSGSHDICNTATGICIAAFKCTDGGVLSDAGNAACTTNSATGPPNCNKNGACIRCNSNADCGATDLGDHQVCNTATGICGPCTLNSDCAGTSGANCMLDGVCRNCGTNSDCGAGKDGGAATATRGTTEDKNAQPICRLNICIDDCNTRNPSNGWCSGATSTWGPNFPNCHADGTCIRCAGPANCGPNVDGGETPAVKGQSVCAADGICVPPFQCQRNVGSSGPSPCSQANGGDNCQKTNNCVDCSVVRGVGTDSFSSNCGTAADADGGETPNQPNCQQAPASRVCVNACTQGSTNADCAGTQGKNCMANGLCVTCLSDDDCRLTTKPWGGDLGGSPLCNDGICGPACEDATCSATTNCMNNGRCVACGSDADCTDTTKPWGGDGPPGRGSNKKCTNGKCVDPYCYHNSDCPATAANCGQAGNCFDCRATGAGQAFAGFSCGAGTGINKGDGPDPTKPQSVGRPNQPNCDGTTGICVDYCTQDSHCTDPCEPFCQKDRGCCVECVENNNCPFVGTTDQYNGATHPDGRLLTWRSAQASSTECDPRFHMCRPATVCAVDEDCDTAGAPACDVTEEKCVECISDDHCSGSTPACSSGQTCIACTTHAHCGDEFCVGGSCYECVTDEACSDGKVCRGLSCVEDTVPDHTHPEYEGDDDDDDDDDTDSSSAVVASFALLLVSYVLFL